MNIGNGDGEAEAAKAARSKRRAESLALVKDTMAKLNEGVYETFDKEEVVRGKQCKNADKYRGIRDKNTKAVIAAVMCVACRKVLSARGTSGVSSYNRQLKDYCPGKPDPSTENNGLKDPPEWAETKFAQSSAKYCAGGLHPPNHFDGPAMRQLIQTTIDITVACGGRIDAAKLISHPTTIS